MSTEKDYNRENNVFNFDPSVSHPAEIEYVHTGVIEPKKFSLGIFPKSAIILGAFAVGALINENLFPGGSIETDSDIDTAVVEAENSISEEELIGLTAEEASDELDSAGINDVTVDHSDVEYGDGIVGSANISDDSAELFLEDHSLDVISSLEIEGLRWPEAEAELTQAGFNNQEDYLVYTDTGTMYVESNWAVDYVDMDSDGVTTRIVVTNEGWDNAVEELEGIGESAQENLNSLLSEDE